MGTVDTVMGALILFFKRERLLLEVVVGVDGQRWGVHCVSGWNLKELVACLTKFKMFIL